MSGFQRSGPSRRKQNVIQDEAVSGRVSMDVEVGGRITDLVLGVLWIMTPVESPGTLSQRSMNVLRPLAFLSQYGYPRLEPLLTERCRESVEVSYHRFMALDQHRRYGIKFRGELEKSKKT